jgi:hypothetical protein
MTDNDLELFVRGPLLREIDEWRWRGASRFAEHAAKDVYEGYATGMITRGAGQIIGKAAQRALDVPEVVTEAAQEAYEAYGDAELLYDQRPRNGISWACGVHTSSLVGPFCVPTR